MLNLFSKSPKRTSPSSSVSVQEPNLLVKQFQDLNINIYGTYEEPLFKAKDIGDLLGIKDINSTIRDFDSDESCMHSMHTAFGTKDINMLTEQGLYKVLMTSRKEVAKQFQKWVYQVIKEIRKKGKYDLEEKLLQNQQQLKQNQQQLKQNQQQLLLKEQELKYYKELTYEEVEKTGYNYILSTDKPGIYKEGLAKDPKKRIKGLQTGNVDDIQILFEYPTSNPALLESFVHFVLDRYRCNSNREHFRCDLEYMKTVIKLAGKMIDTLKSSFHTISKEELLERLEMDIYIEEEIEEENEVENEESEFYNWCNENIIYKKNSILKLSDVCDLYLGKKVSSRVSTKYRKEIEKFIKEKYSNIDYEYKQYTINNLKIRGWLHVSIL